MADDFSGRIEDSGFQTIRPAAARGTRASVSQTGFPAFVKIQQAECRYPCRSTGCLRGHEQLHDIGHALPEGGRPAGLQYAVLAVT